MTQSIQVRIPMHLVDLHEMKRVRLPAITDLQTRVAAAQQWLNDEFDNSVRGRFYPHLSVHEVEAWIFAEGKAVARRLHNPRITPEPNAEEKNDLNPPKKQLDTLFKRNGRMAGYGETRDGKPLFEQLDFKTVYQACGFFRAFYDDLTAVARSALNV